MSGEFNINKIMLQAENAFQHYKKIKAQQRVDFLKSIASQIEALGDDLIHVAMEESHLPEARIRNERARTTNQLKAFAELLQSGDWVQATIDTGDPKRAPAPKPAPKSTPRRRSDTPIEAMAKSAARSVGRQVATELVRGILGSFFGGKRSR